jgi:uncharacterized protein
MDERNPDTVPGDGPARAAALGPAGADAAGEQSRIAWRPVSPHLTTVRLLGSIWFFVLLLAGSGAAVWGAISAGLWWLWLVALIGPLLIGWTCWLVPRQVRALRWAPREDDLLIRRGLLFRQTVAVPYGRMQYLDVTEGPLRRRWGLATLELHTAAEATDASLPGLPRDEAKSLRDILAQRGQARLAGL